MAMLLLRRSLVVLTMCWFGYVISLEAKAASGVGGRKPVWICYMDAHWVHEAPSSTDLRTKSSSDCSCDWLFRLALFDGWTVDVIAGPVSSFSVVETS